MKAASVDDRAETKSGSRREDHRLSLVGLLLQDLVALLREPQGRHDAQWADAVIEKLLQLFDGETEADGRTAADGPPLGLVATVDDELAHQLRTLRERLVCLRQRIAWDTTPLSQTVDDELKAALLTSIKKLVRLIRRASQSDGGLTPE
ncbi:MAG TPA: hypothetical protein EYP14_08590 [Planctomycetaceae bacterium]|nr:hypothetical protein [Planctomycetaceae bacterium]